MRFKDEKFMWHGESVRMAAQLANKSEREVQEILNRYNVVELRLRDRSTVSMLGRILSLVIYPLLIVVVCLKWICTGNRYLDTWAKKYPSINKLTAFCGIK